MAEECVPMDQGRKRAGSLVQLPTVGDAQDEALGISNTCDTSPPQQLPWRLHRGHNRRGCCGARGSLARPAISKLVRWEGRRAGRKNDAIQKVGRLLSASSGWIGE
ncbi:hypothetical protein FA13DRAFT_1727196 [Coprinellus micaceus]|uniref:Uncharacterized protein n=1 Tax=Coprinellus micaceus TaxID=71717 RepID=A0A4Y7TRL5_COPMI|nr:hypothetical protein FA13DRAFT_1727196 [Coprinellus micaceus]